MSQRLARRAVQAAAILAALVCASPAFADDEIIPGHPTGAGAPFAITRCRVARSGNFWHGTTLNVINRTKHQLLGGSVTLRFYDADNALIGQSKALLPVETPLVSSETAAYTTPFAGNMTEPASAVVRIECRPADATFSGNKKWVFGQRWTEKLLPLPTAENASGGGAGGQAAASVTAAPRVQISVVNAWNDTVNGVLYVHDRLTVTGGGSDATLRASDFTLIMNLANGARKAYTGLPQPAPTYQKLNPLGSQATTAYEVDPSADLGRLGAITVPAHGTVTTTVTFVVSEAVSNPSDNRQVALK